ncbi:MAG: HisA/HisF-related TIM barrel protein [Acidimicrobiia bacterium]
MDLYARVNVLGERAVRLPHGDVTDAIALDADPVSRARGWVAKGADHLHVVDLDAAAYGDYRNRPLIHQIIAELDVQVQVAGGVRSAKEATNLIEAGAWRIVMGTAAIEDQIMVWDLCRQYPDQITVSLDVLPDEELVVRGWTAHSGRFLEEVLIEMSSAGAAAFLVSEAGRDALTEPPNFGVLREAISYVDEPVIAAGGARNLDDLTALINLEADGKRLGGVVVGREVIEGRFTMEEARKLLSEA